jgi:LysR family glycine cleavage system transcriptional activator
MSQALPPLNALRAFEAAARHGNFARAAQELHVTPGALSHQIRALEALLGVTLFERQARGVALTPSGRALNPGLASAFALIRDSVQSLRERAGSRVVVVSTPPAFTSKWLVPRLHRFAQEHPEVELRIASSAAYANFSVDGVDVAVRNVPIAKAREATLSYEHLIDDELVAVCSPALLNGGVPDLRRIGLIHDDQLSGRPEVPTWTEWFRAAGVPPADLQRGLRFSSAEHAIEAAVQGAGVLLGHTLLLHDDVVSGRLVLPWPVALATGRAYYLVQPMLKRTRPAVQAFGTWLHAEMAAMGRP